MVRPNSTQDFSALRRAIVFVGLTNLAYFAIELSVALSIHSASLIADSIDFLEDASVNFLILVALNWAPRLRACVGLVLAALLLAPALATLWTVARQLIAPVVPEPFTLSVTGLGALAVNLTCAFVLVRFRHHRGSLTKAAFLSARNDAFANVAIIAAGLLTLFWPSIWPDLIVGIAIAILNAGAAKEVIEAARSERDARP